MRSEIETVRSTDGTTIAFDRLGSGPPLILVGGAFSRRSFRKLVELAELLARDFTVINYDRRGRGDSGDTPPYAVEREIEDVQALIAAAGGSASVWGWSSGGALALRAAASGVRFERIAVYEPPFVVDRSGHVPPADLAVRLERLVAARRRAATVRLFMTEGMGLPRVFVGLMRLTPFWSQLKATAHTAPYDWAVLGAAMAGEPLDPAEWAGVGAPTLVLSGEKSPARLRDAAQAVASVVPAARIRRLAGESHNPSMKALAPVLANFFGGAGEARLPDGAARERFKAA